MLELINKTPFEVSMTPVTLAEGYEVLAVFFAASCVLVKGKWHVCVEQMRSPMGDVFWNPDEPSSIRFPSQLAFDKPATDVIVNGVAFAPQQRDVTALEVAVAVGQVSATAHVFGERVWHHGRISSPQPFQRLPLVWENAFGGSEIVKDTEVSYQHNALGKGWRPDDWPEENYNGIALPNVEWPQNSIRHPKDRPIPAGFGALPPNMPSRAQYAGTYDEHWQATRAPFMPTDFDPRFFCAATPVLQYSGFMRGDEQVKLTNLNPRGELDFNLPVMRPHGEVKTANNVHKLNFSLQTVVIETEDLIVRMFWQGQVPMARTLADMRQIKVALN